MKFLRNITLILCLLMIASCDHKDMALRELRFMQTWINMTEGDSAFVLPVTVVPEEAADVLISWTSSNPEVATVSHEGVITPISEGETDIIASAGEVSATCRVTVSKKKVVPDDPEEPDDPVIPDNPVYVSGIRIDRTELDVAEGLSDTLRASVFPDNADNQTVYYKSCKPDIATVDDNGRITGLNAGQTVITVTSAEGGFTAYCLVTVLHTVIHVTDIAIDRASVEISEGESATLSASVVPQNADNTEFTWSIADNGVASIDKSGRITGIREGKTVAYATSADGGLKDSCAVAVKHVVVPVTGLKMLDDVIYLNVGDVYSPAARIEPQNADNRNIIWTVADTRIASVDAEGLVSAHATGHTTLKAVSEDGGYEGVCDINVEETPTGISKVEIAPSEVTLRQGHSTKLEIVFTPANATNRQYSITSDNESVAAVSADGNVTARSTGNAVITVKTIDGNCTAACRVTVIPEFIHVSDISLNKASLIMIEGETSQLTAKVLPADADNPAVRFESSNSEVASVNSYGMVTALKAGNATISAITLDGELRASASVEVKAAVVPLESIAIDKTSLTLHYPDQAQLKVLLTPSNASVGNIEWSCGNPETVEVDNTGKVTAKGIGKAVVTASCGGITAACTITVEHTVITSVKINSDLPVISVESGSTYQLSATVLPENASDKTIRWSSSDTGVATVNADGLVTFGRFGEEKIVTITAESVATPGIVSKQGFSVKEGSPALVINGSKTFFDFTTGQLAEKLTGGRIYTLDFGDVTLNATDIQAIKDRARSTLNSIDLSKVKFAVDGTQFIGYQINSNVQKVSITGETEVPNYLFYEFSSLTKVKLPECTTKIGVRVFCDSAIDSLVVPPGTISIGQGAFASCPIASVIFNDGLKTIGENLFSIGTHVDNIEEIILPDSVTSIGSDSFFGLTKLKRFRFSPSINAGSNPLSGCTSLTTIEVSEENKKMKVLDGCLVSYNNILLLTYPVGLSKGETDITIGNGVRRITSHACNYLANTGCVTVAEGIEYIDNSMQFGTFTSVDLPSTLLYLAYNAFMSSPVRKVTLHSTTPPTVSGGLLMLPGVKEILVPAESVDAYKESTYWKQFAGMIKGY